MVFFLIVLAAGVAFIVWQLYQKKVAAKATNEAVPNTGTPVPQKGTQPGPLSPYPSDPSPKSPTDPAVTSVVIGTATEALTGKIGANGPVYTGPAIDLVRHDENLDTPVVQYELRAGVREWTFLASAGTIYQFATAETYLPVTMEIQKSDGASILPPTSVKNGEEVRYQAQDSGPLKIITNATSAGHFRYLIVG